MAKQYFIPGDGMINDQGNNREYFIPGDGGINEGGTAPGGGGEPSGQDKLMRHGAYFADGVKKPFWWAR